MAFTPVFGTWGSTAELQVHAPGDLKPRQIDPMRRAGIASGLLLKVSISPLLFSVGGVKIGSFY
jgi:hypothetical protein